LATYLIGVLRISAILFVIKYVTYHAFERDLECTNSGEDLKCLKVRVIVRDELTVDLEVDPCLGDLIY